MRCGYIQYNVSKNVRENLYKISEMAAKKKSSIYVLPEMSFTGYLFSGIDEMNKYINEIKNEKVEEFMLELSEKHNTAFIYNIPKLEDDNLYNTSVIVSKGNYKGYYNKIHLTDYEKKFFTNGNKIKVFELDDIKIGVQICFDIWFCEISRQQILNGADILLISANFGSIYTYNISKMRALENAVPVVLCNRIGSEKNKDMDAVFTGKSAVFSKMGEEIGKSVKNKEKIEVKDIEISSIKSNIICSNMLDEIKVHYKC